MSGPAPLRSADQLTEADPASRLRPVLAAKPAACPLRAGGRLARRPLGTYVFLKKVNKPDADMA